MTHARRLTLALLAALPLLAWPGLPQPFSTPKLWTLVATVLLLAPFAAIAHFGRRRGAAARALAAGTAASGIGAAAVLRRPEPTADPHQPGPSAPHAADAAASSSSAAAVLWRPEPMADRRQPRPSARARSAAQLLAFCWLVSWTWSALLGDLVSVEVVLLAFSAALLAVILVEIGATPGQVAGAMVVGGTGVAVVAVGQAVGVDPFAMAGWVAPIGGGSARLRVYGTLGNPNFVAAVLVASAPLTVSLLARSLSVGRLRAGGRGRGLGVVLAGALGLQVVGAMATGSRAGALGLLAAALTWAALARGPRWRWMRITVATLGCVLALAAIAISTARPLEQTLAGRAYILGVSWPHAWEAPWAGRGPGAFELLYPGWERDSRSAQSGHGQPGQPGRHSQAFAGPQQHAHNDYLEALIDRGLAGPVTILCILATCFRNGWRHARRTHDASIAIGAVSMLAALAAIACVDFPLARPTELTWWWCAVALISLSNSGDADGTFNKSDVDVDVGADLGPDGPGDRPGDRHDGRGGPRGSDEVLGKT